MKKRHYLAPEFEKKYVELIEDCLDASNPGHGGDDLDDDWWDTPGGSRSISLGTPDPKF